MFEEAEKPSGLIERSVENLVAVLLSLVPGTRSRAIHAEASDALVAFAAYLAVGALSYLALDSYAQFDAEFLQGRAGWAALSIACGVMALWALRREGAGALAVGLLWSFALGAGLAIVTSMLFDIASMTGWILAGVLPSYVPPLLFLLGRLGIPAGLAVALAAGLPSLMVAYDWYAYYTSDGENSAAMEMPDTEMVYAVQRDLLSAETDVRPGEPGKAEMFAVLGAGFAYEGVFGREVRAVAQLLEAGFGAEGRVVRLINDDDAPTGYPLLNRVNLEAALRRVGQAMNAEDILFLFLTSHGGPGTLSTRFYPVITRDIGPEDIDKALTDAGIGNAVVVISSCYSGSFSEILQRPDRLILTAARSDRTSFGCSDQAEWTEWGRAFFVDALPGEPDPRKAALSAQRTVSEREKAEGLEPSEPQIIEGAEIGRAIDAWLAVLRAR